MFHQLDEGGVARPQPSSEPVVPALHFVIGSPHSVESCHMHITPFRLHDGLVAVAANPGGLEVIEERCEGLLVVSYEVGREKGVESNANIVERDERYSRKHAQAQGEVGIPNVEAA